MVSKHLNRSLIFLNLISNIFVINTFRNQFKQKNQPTHHRYVMNVYTHSMHAAKSCRNSLFVVVDGLTDVVLVVVAAALAALSSYVVACVVIALHCIIVDVWYWWCLLEHTLFYVFSWILCRFFSCCCCWLNCCSWWICCCSGVFWYQLLARLDSVVLLWMCNTAATITTLTADGDYWNLSKAVTVLVLTTFPNRRQWQPTASTSNSSNNSNT